MQIVGGYGAYTHFGSANWKVELTSTDEIVAVLPQLRSNVEAVSKQCEGTIEMRNQVVIKKCKWQRWMQDASYIGMLKFESLGQDVSRRLYTRNDEMMLTGWAIHWDTLFALITLTPNRPHFYFCDATVDHTFCIPIQFQHSLWLVECSGGIGPNCHLEVQIPSHRQISQNQHEVWRWISLSIFERHPQSPLDEPKISGRVRVCATNSVNEKNLWANKRCANRQSFQNWWHQQNLIKKMAAEVWHHAALVDATQASNSIWHLRTALYCCNTVVSSAK